MVKRPLITDGGRVKELAAGDTIEPLAVSSPLVINVQSEGIVADGSTDQTTALQDRVNSAIGSGQSEVVYLPAGIYKLSTLNIAGRCRIVGDGRARTILYSDSNAPILNITADGGFQGPSIENLTVRGTVTAGSSQIGIKITDASYVYGVQVKNVRIENCGDHGLWIGNCFSSFFSNIQIDNCAGYPFEYDAANMPGNIFDHIYVETLRTGATTAFRIRKGVFVGRGLNGINNTLAGSKFMVVGEKTGVDGAGSSSGAIVVLYDSNLESFVSHGILAYHASFIGLKGKTTISGAGLSANQIGIEFDLVGNGSAFYSQLISRGYIEDSVDFSDGVAAYKDNQPIHANGFPPIQILGQGPGTGGGAELHTYRNTSTSADMELSRADGRFIRKVISSTTNINEPGVKYIEIDTTGGAFTLTIPWAGWYNRAHDLLIIKDVGGACATNNLTVATQGGGSIDGTSTYTLNLNKAALVLMPDGNTGAGDWRIIGLLFDWDDAAQSLILPGKFRAMDSAGSEPSFSFRDDPDTGFFRATSGETGYSSNGVEHIRLADRLIIFRKGSGAGEGGAIELWDIGNDHAVIIKAPDSITSSYTLTMPADDGNADEFLKTNGTGTLSWSNSLVNPLIVTGIKDANGNQILGFTPIASAVNYLRLTNAATGNNPSLKADGETNVDMILGGKGTGILRADTAFTTDLITLTDAATIATDASDSSQFEVTLGGNRTLGAPTNGRNGQIVRWRIRQPGSGGPYTLTLDTGTGGFKFGAKITSITLSTAASAVDYLVAIYDSSQSKWHVVGFNDGF